VCVFVRVVSLRVCVCVVRLFVCVYLCINACVDAKRRSENDQIQINSKLVPQNRGDQNEVGTQN
jgi:hypothetical protein